jgi:protein-disulfide isomerase
MATSPSPNPAETRRRRLQVAAAVVAAALVAVIIVVASSGGTTPRGPSLPGAGETTEMLAGIPQRGIALGDPAAPVTLVEIADAQCPFCRHFALYELPHVIAQQVRTGRLRIELRLVAFLGPDSERGRRALQATAAQDRLWHATHLLYFNQGRENSGYMTDTYVRGVLDAVPGLDLARALRDRGSRSVDRALLDSDRLAARNAADATPTFLIGPTGGRLRVLTRQLTTADYIGRAVDRFDRRAAGA